ncbi:MAG: hypothetical protein RR448_06435 [Niameybacter sp.]|uniref:hypothetical protein n=1 Tax=Niameybacter sp. TaxID=2033640 RepID=UPI002FC62E71
MKKLMMMLMLLGMSLSIMLTGCNQDKEKVDAAQEGQVVEIEGKQDQYGWFPHMRLTFAGDTLTEVYFDYVDDNGAKKSDDDEYNSTMKEKTGVSGKEAMEMLRQNIIAVQNPMAVDVVTGATQTSEEFIAMADQGFKQYFNGEVSANNYGKGDPTTAEDDKAKTGKANTNTKSDSNGTETTGENAPTYDNGGDGSPNNAENSGNAEGTGAGGGAQASSGTGASK